MDAVIGRTLSHYQIREEICRGGMGVVYRALDTTLDREVAVKILPPELMADETRRHRFVLEAKAAAAIHHPHIATIHEIDERSATARKLGLVKAMGSVRFPRGPRAPWDASRRTLCR